MSDEIVRLHYNEAELRRDGAKALHQFGVHATYKTIRMIFTSCSSCRRAAPCMRSTAGRSF